MSLLSIIAALLLEQWRALSDRRVLLGMLEGWVGSIERLFSEGARRSPALWWVAIVPVLLGAVFLHRLLDAASPLFAWLFDVGVLYLTLGFRQFSHAFTRLHAAIRADDLEQARSELCAWRGEPYQARTREEVIRLAIEEALLAAHRHVFGVLFWYVILPGPSGAILYRFALHLKRRWNGSEAGPAGAFAQRVAFALDWPAVRVSAASFTVAGNFEDAVTCWRTQARHWADPNAGVVLAAGAGALGVRLGMPMHVSSGAHLRTELGVGDEADGTHLDSVVGLLWRALIVWIFVLALFSVGHVLA